jgi:hypothetical protein
MAVTVTTWAELLTACAGSEAIVWGGASRLESVTLTVASECTNKGTIAVNAPSIDFNGLTIGTISTTGTRNFHDDNLAQNIEAWERGFCAVYSDSVFDIYNLTVEHIALENPRDILCQGLREMRNVYCYDIYAPSVEHTSKWLRDSGRTQDQTQYRSRSNYILRGSAGATYVGAVGFGIANACIFKVRTENAGITFAYGRYENCELDLDYTFSWDESKKGDNWEYLCIFPQSTQAITLVNCTITGTFKLESNWSLLFCARKYAVYETVMNMPSFVANDCIWNFKTIASNDFQDLIIEDKYFLWYHNVGAGSHNSFVTNNGNYSLDDNDLPSDFKVLLGDMRNIDILHDRGYEVVEDDEFRQPQYNTDSVDWERRIYPSVNDGLPFLPMWYYPIGSTPTPTPTDDIPDYICIYDMETPQDGFEGNGLAILTPTQCRVTEELNGGYNLTLEHPKDNEGKWRFILEMNIIKCLGQLFIIRKVVNRNTENKRSVVAYAEHITYHLNDYWLFPGTSIAGYRGQTLIDSILAQMWDVGEEGQTRYSFDIKTDLDAEPTFKEWYEMPEGHTPYEMILGSNGFTSLIGGELYRDNFTVKINESMYGAEDNAFVLHPDLNLKSIEKTVDVQTFCTYFRAYDEYGGWWAVAWDPRTLPRAYPHNIVRSQNFTFDVDKEYYSMDMLARKGQDYFGRNCAPLISFRLQVQDLKKHPEYKDFVNNYRFKVGDIGKVWDDDAERYYDLEITRTVKDGITGECIEVVIGAERSFTRPSGYPITLDRNFKWYVAGEYDPDNPPEPPEPPYIPTSVIDYVYEESEADITLIMYLGQETRVLVPTDNEGKPVKTISSLCFGGQFDLEAVTIPEGVEVIE